jgi:membrane dipeptidase
VRSFSPYHPMKPLLIDAHQDLAYNALTFGRDYRLSARETRAAEAGTATIERTGDTLLGWPEFQSGQVALIFATLFLAPPAQSADWETQVPRSPLQAHNLWREQVDYYRRLAGEAPDMFRQVMNRGDLADLFALWEQSPADLDANPPCTHPTGLLLLMEGAEAIGQPRDLEEWWEAGVRLVGPVWAGERFCGGTFNPQDGFTREGYELLDVMSGLGMGLDLSHMNEKSALQALDCYEGAILATHANTRALLHQPDNERHLTDLTIRRLVERGGAIGVLPFGKFIRPGWSASDDARLTTLDHVLAHIDHICQLAGDALHVGVGTDFDGGFGWPHVPYEIETIADLQKLTKHMLEHGYDEDDVNAIFNRNWRRLLEKALPA